LHLFMPKYLFFLKCQPIFYYLSEPRMVGMTRIKEDGKKRFLSRPSVPSRLSAVQTIFFPRFRHAFQQPESQMEPPWSRNGSIGTSPRALSGAR